MSPLPDAILHIAVPPARPSPAVFLHLLNPGSVWRDCISSPRSSQVNTLLPPSLCPSPSHHRTLVSGQADMDQLSFPFRSASLAASQPPWSRHPSGDRPLSTPGPVRPSLSVQVGRVRRSVLALHAFKAWKHTTSQSATLSTMQLQAIEYLHVPARRGPRDRHYRGVENADSPCRSLRSPLCLSPAHHAVPWIAWRGIRGKWIDRTRDVTRITATTWEPPLPRF
jgi:hypothetical protein